MPTIVEKTIGPGGDYSTISAWIAAIPADLVTADQVWRGMVLNTELTATGSGGFGTISGKTCSADCYIELTAAANASFADHASKATNPLRYDATKGAALRFTASTGVGLSVQVPYFRLTRLQIFGADTSATAPSLVIFSTTGCIAPRVEGCILESATAASNGLITLFSQNSSAPAEMRNTVVIQRRTDSGAKLATLSNGARVTNSVFVSLGATLTSGLVLANVKSTLRNVYVGGVTAPDNGSGVTVPDKFNCFSSATATGYTQAALSAATFISVTAGSHDLRLPAGSALIDAGSADAQVTTDVYGTTRPQGTAYDVGAWEYTAPPSAPVFTTHPGGSSTPAGGTATFTAAASGSPAPTYQWSVSADSGATWSDISGATSATLTLSGVVMSDSGKQYRVTATNSQGSATSNAATLVVTAVAPTITTQPSSQSVVTGGTATFTVAATNVASYQWQRLPSGGAWGDISGATASSFTTPATTVSGGSANNGDQYRCVLTSSSGGTVTSNAATLTVLAAAVAPSVTTQPTAQTVTAGGTATFTAAFSGTSPTYQWARSTDSGASWNNISGATATSYTTPATAVSGGSANNGDQYRCTATNSAGSATTNAVTLTVNAAAAAPTIATPPIKNNAGTLLASISGWTANIYNTTTGALILQKTGLSTNAAGILLIQDAALAAATTYAYELVHATYGRRLPTGTAA